MEKFLPIAAGALAALGFSTSAAAQTGSASAGTTAEEHQRMMSGSGMSDDGQTMSDPDIHRRMMAMMQRREEMIAKKDKRVFIFSHQSARKASAEGRWAWRPAPNQAPGPRASLRPPIRVWLPDEKSAKQ